MNNTIKHTYTIRTCTISTIHTMELLRQDIQYYLVGCKWRFDSATGIAACVREHMCGMYKIEGTKIEQIMQTYVVERIDTDRWIFSDNIIRAQTDKGAIEIDSRGAVIAFNANIALKDVAGVTTSAHKHVFDYCGVSVRVTSDGVLVGAQDCKLDPTPEDLQSLLNYDVILRVGENKYLCEDNSGRMCICRISGDLRAALDEHI